MIEVEGKPVIQHAVSAFKTGGLRDVTVVTGYKPEAFNLTSFGEVQAQRQVGDDR